MSRFDFMKSLAVIVIKKNLQKKKDENYQFTSRSRADNIGNIRKSAAWRKISKQEVINYRTKRTVDIAFPKNRMTS
jgi:hypothetical protein